MVGAARRRQPGCMITEPGPAGWQTNNAMTRHLPGWLAEPFRRRTWAEFLYALVALPIVIAGFVFTVVTLSVSAGLLGTFIGLPLLAVTGLASRYTGSGLRRLANRLVGADIPAPPPFRANPGMLGWIGSCLGDGAAWR